MRCGADALKRDLRVHAGLRELGFELSSDAHTLLVGSAVICDELGVTPLVLDQALWWARG